MEKMIEESEFRILIKTAPVGTYTLTNVFSAPRQCSPVDIKAAATSVELIAQRSDMPNGLFAFASFMTLGFFALAHRTGLYNRQRNLWESIGRVVEICCQRPRRGIFKKVNEPFVDVFCLDAKGAVLIFGRLADADMTALPEKAKKYFVSEALKRAQEIKRSQGFLFGLFLAVHEDLPQSVQLMIDEMTSQADPIARYESCLPAPLNVPLNVVKLETVTSAVEPMNISLIHPSLRLAEQESSVAGIS